MFTPEEVARLHECDLKAGERHGAHIITYWYHAGAATGFCLVEAPSREAVDQTHRDAHGNVPNRIIEVDWPAVENFLGPIRQPEPAWENFSLRTVVCVSSVTPQSRNRVSAGEMTELFLQSSAFTQAEFDDRGGRTVHSDETGITGMFPSITGALECALAIQRSCVSVAFFSQKKMDLRIGVSAGEPVTQHMNLFGQARDEAIILSSKASAGSVYVSSVVRDLCDGKGFDFESRGELRLNGQHETALSVFELTGKRRSEQFGAHGPYEAFRAHDEQFGTSGRTALTVLSGREIEVLRCIAEGSTNREIADYLCISLSTVATHVRNIFEKIQVSNRAEAVSYAYRKYLV